MHIHDRTFDAAPTHYPTEAPTQYPTPPPPTRYPTPSDKGPLYREDGPPKIFADHVLLGVEVEWHLQLTQRYRLAWHFLCATGSFSYWHLLWMVPLSCATLCAAHRVYMRRDGQNDGEEHELVGKRVRVVDVHSKPELNGQEGRCDAWIEEKSRYHVLLDSNPEHPICLKPHNVVSVEEI